MKRTDAFERVPSCRAERDVLGNDLVDPSPLANCRYVFVSDPRHGSRVYVPHQTNGVPPPSQVIVSGKPSL